MPQLQRLTLHSQSFPGSLKKFAQQLVNRHAQRYGDAEQAGVAAGTFQIGDVRSRQLAAVGEHLLRPCIAFSSALDVGGEAAPD